MLRQQQSDRDRDKEVPYAGATSKRKFLNYSNIQHILSHSSFKLNFQEPGQISIHVSTPHTMMGLCLCVCVCGAWIRKAESNTVQHINLCICIRLGLKCGMRMWCMCHVVEVWERIVYLIYLYVVYINVNHWADAHFCVCARSNISQSKCVSSSARNAWQLLFRVWCFRFSVNKHENMLKPNTVRLIVIRNTPPSTRFA